MKWTNKLLTKIPNPVVVQNFFAISAIISCNFTLVNWFISIELPMYSVQNVYLAAANTHLNITL